MYYGCMRKDSCYVHDVSSPEVGDSVFIDYMDEVSEEHAIGEFSVGSLS